MKKSSLLFFVLFLAVKVSLGKSYFEIKGAIKNTLDISIYINYDTIRNHNLSIENNHFLYKAASREIFTPISLTIKNNQSNTIFQVVFLIAQNSKISINIKNPDSIPYGKGIKISGLPFQMEEEAFRNSILPLQTEYYKFYSSEVSKMSSGGFNKNGIDSIKKGIKIVKTHYVNCVLNFIVQNQHSYYSLYLFKSIILKPTYTLSLDRDQVKSTFMLFDGDIKQTPLWAEIEKLMSLKVSLEIGQKAANFNFKTNTKGHYSLNNILSTKKVLLIFTSKYCGGCIEQIPIVKDIESKIIDKRVQIIYVSLDKTEKDWFATLKKNYPGMQTCDLPAYTGGKRIRDLYNVELIPQIFLINSLGEIVYNNILLKDDDALHKLKSILCTYKCLPCPL